MAYPPLQGAPSEVRESEGTFHRRVRVSVVLHLQQKEAAGGDLVLTDLFAFLNLLGQAALQYLPEVPHPQSRAKGRISP